MTAATSTERQFDPARGYRIFDEFLGRIEPGILASAPALGGYPRDAVGRRLVQRVVDLTFRPFIEASAANHARGIDPTPPVAGTVRYGALRFRGDRVTVTLAARLRSLAEFCAYWVWVLAYLIGPRREAIPERATLLLGVGFESLEVDGSDARFMAFCNRGPLPLLRGATHLVVESRRPLISSTPGRVSYSRQPLLALLRAQLLRGRDVLFFLGTHLAAAASYFRYSLTHPLACVLARDMAFHGPATELNRRGALEAVVITNSHFRVQPLWMRALPGRRFKVHMAWYSQNTAPFVYKPDGLRADMPPYRHMVVDAHWVWTDGYANYLRGLGTSAELNVVGPILWYLPETRPAAALRPSVAIFDVTPVKEAVARKIGLPRNYYSTANMIAFLQQVTGACEHVAAQLGRPVSVVLKHKRSYGETHDSRYIEFIDRLAAAGAIRLLPPQTSLYSVIGASSAIVVVPYSSPAYVASSLKVPAIYLDASESIEATYEPAPFVDFASGEAELARKLLAALADGPRSH